MNKKYFELDSGHSTPIKLNLFEVKSSKPLPLTIISHGFKAFRNWGFIPYLAEKISSSVGHVITIDFSMNGIDDEQKMLYDVDVFRKNTVGVELDDLRILHENLESLDLKNWNGEIYLLGHSMGGAISILTAGKFDKVKKLSLWGTISKWNRNTKRQIDEWKEKGFMEFKESISGQTLYLDYTYQEYKEKHKDEIDIRISLSKLNIPVQIIHGNLDMTVPPKEGEILFKKAIGNNPELHLIPKTGHTFGAKHPMLESNPELDLSIDHTIKFLNS